MKILMDGTNFFFSPRKNVKLGTGMQWTGWLGVPRRSLEMDKPGTMIELGEDVIPACGYICWEGFYISPG
jgi:hypothetical protein